MDQTVINFVIAAAGALGGFVLNQLWAAVKDLQTADKSLTDKLNAVEVLVAGNYVSRADFKQAIDALFAKLDRMEDLIHKKQDKGHGQ